VSQIQPRRPEFMLEDASALARDLYGATGELEELSSERDRNFLIRPEAGEACVLKIANTNEDFAVLEFQNAMLLRLEDSDLSASFPKVVVSAAGRTIESAVASEGDQHFVRLLSYLEGQPLAEIPTRSGVLLHSFGRLLGRMTRVLEGFTHPASMREFHWNLTGAYETIQFLRSNVIDPNRQTTLDHYLSQYEESVRPELANLRTGVIHNDANDHNVITRSVPVPDAGLDFQVVMGLVDFGDAMRSHTVNELAVALAYVMLEAADPIADACRVVGSYHREYALTSIEQEVVFPLVCMRLCLSVSICALQQTLDPDNEYLRITEQPAWQLLENLRAIDPNIVTQKLKTVCDSSERSGDHSIPVDKEDRTVTTLGKPVSQIQQERDRLIGPSLSISYKQPLKIVRGYMQYLFDEAGRAYLDAVNNVPHVGHCHPRVVAAGQRQMAVLNTNTRYLHDNLTEYASRLTATMPESLSVCFFVCSGSEANELAIRLARAHTGGFDFIVIDGAYHGNSSGLVELSPYKFNGPGGRGAPEHVHVVPTPDTFRGLHRSDESDPGVRYAEHVGETVTSIRSSGRYLAGFFAESIMGCAGQIEYPQGFLQRAFQYVRDSGGVCIADEVQIGFGRVGTHFWAFETQRVVPDIVTLGKPIGNGHPLAAVVTTPEIARSFANGMEYFNTFGGNPVSCAIGMAVLDVIEEEGLQANALEVGTYLKQALQSLARRYDVIGGVRGRGLFIGVELVESHNTLAPNTVLATAVVEKMKAAGVLVSTDGPDENVIKIKPPMVFTSKNADQLVKVMDAALVSAC